MQPRAKSYGFVERTVCPLCGSGAATTVYSSSFSEPPISTFIETHYKIPPAVLTGAPYELVRCGDCRLLYQKWIGDLDLLSELYGSWINDHSNPDRDWKYQQDITRVWESRDCHEVLSAASFLELDCTQMWTLDFGMGWALWARIARFLGCRSYGCDLSESRMEFARAHGIQTVAADELPSERFHFINTEQVMEHVVEPQRVAQRLARALVPGGVLKVSVPSGERADLITERLVAGNCRGTREELMPVQPLEHVNCYTRSSLRNMAQSLGLKFSLNRVSDIDTRSCHFVGPSLCRIRRSF